MLQLRVLDGVAISVTTIPAAAFLGVAPGIGRVSEAFAVGLEVLGANVAMMLVGGSSALAVQRALPSGALERCGRS